jgi:hypothetical protein
VESLCFFVGLWCFEAAGRVVVNAGRGVGVVVFGCGDCEECWVEVEIENESMENVMEGGLE